MQGDCEEIFDGKPRHLLPVCQAKSVAHLHSRQTRTRYDEASGCPSLHAGRFVVVHARLAIMLTLNCLMATLLTLRSSDPRASPSSHHDAESASKQKRSRSATSLNSPSSPSAVAKVAQQSLPEGPARRPSQPAAASKKSASSPGASVQSPEKQRAKESTAHVKTSPPVDTNRARTIPFQEGLSFSDGDDDHQPLKKAKLSASSSASNGGVSGLLAPGGAAARAQIPATSSPRAGYAHERFLVFFVSYLRVSVERLDIDDPDFSEPQPNAPSPRERRAFLISQFLNDNPQKDKLLKSLANVAAPIVLTQEQKDALDPVTVNWKRIKEDLGIWSNKDILAIMMKLSHQVKTEEINNFFVRLRRYCAQLLMRSFASLCTHSPVRINVLHLQEAKPTHILIWLVVSLRAGHCFSRRG